MSVKMTQKREKAARMVAEDRYSDSRIANEVGVSERTLERWKEQQNFQGRVQEIVHAYSRRALKCGLARVMSAGLTRAQ